MREIRKFTGLCPQYDVLVDNMTCKEHLYLYAALKGIKKSEVDWEVRCVVLTMCYENTTPYTLSLYICVYMLLV